MTDCIKCIHFSVCSRHMGGMNLVKCEDYYEASRQYDDYDIYFDRIVRYFEKQENWRKLKECWFIGGRSDEFRAMLIKAMEADDNV